MIWLCLIFAFLLLLLFYPLRIQCDIQYENETWKGNIVLFPFFGCRWPKVILYPSKDAKLRKTGLENPAKKKKGDEQSLWQDFSLSEQIPEVLELLMSTKQSIKRLRIRIKFGYGFEDPALMGYLTGAIYAALPVIFGDFRHTKWRIRLEPQWGLNETVAFLQFESLLNLFSMIRSFGPLLPKILKIMPKKTRRNERCQNIPSNP